MNKKRFNALIVIVTFGIFLSFFLFHQGAGATIEAIRALRPSWILAAVCFMVLSWMFEMLVLYAIIKDRGGMDKVLLRAFKFQMVGQFFGAISPFSAGSHPAQLYAMTENGIPAGEAGSILMIKFMIHQVVNIVILGISTLCMFRYFDAQIQYFAYLCGLGLAVHVAVLLFSVMVLVNRSLTERLLATVFGMLKRMRLVKDPASAYRNLTSELNQFHANAALMAKRIRMCAVASLLTFLQYAAYFTIPYCIYRSFGFHAADLWTLVNAQIFLFNFMAIIPLPGAAGGAEGGFYFIYGLFFASNTILPALFVWRLLSYYASVGFSGLFALALPNVKKSH